MNALMLVLAIEISSPGFAPSSLEQDGRLVEDWGAVAVKLTGEGVTAAGAITLQSIKLDDVIPAARAVSPRGAVTMSLTAFRAPAWPAGLDVLTVRVEETAGQPAAVTVALDLPADAKLGNRTVKLGGRTILTLPAETLQQLQLRDWGYCDDATSLPGWAKPEGNCDAAFRNIRAGLGGVPIAYRFNCTPKSGATVVLGICESHWQEPGQRPLVCRVEGAGPQTVDPVAKWGRHKPGALVFKARDENGDGKLDIVVRSTGDAPDQNPILNAIWIYPAKENVDVTKVITGALNAAATRYVDVGGAGDQSIFPTEKLEYKLSLPARGAQELTFFVACAGSSAPVPAASAWTTETLRRAAREVWRGWAAR